MKSIISMLDSKIKAEKGNIKDAQKRIKSYRDSITRFESEIEESKSYLSELIEAKRRIGK